MDLSLGEDIICILLQLFVYNFENNIEMDEGKLA